MGKASRWLRALMGLKKPDSEPGPTHKAPKKKWTFIKSYKDKELSVKLTPEKSHQDGLVPVNPNDETDSDASKHAIAVAAASAAVAEAAVTAAQAAAAVVRLTTSGRTTDSGVCTVAQVNQTAVSYVSLEDWAAVTIQSHFRAYLSRKALRALKALVKLQALVKGYLRRKHNAEYLRRYQVLLRAQARAQGTRAMTSKSPFKSSQPNHPGPATPEKFEHVSRSGSMKKEHSMMLKRNEQHSNSKILEVDNGKPYIKPKRRNLFHSSHLTFGMDQISHSFSTSKESPARLSPPHIEVESPLKFAHDVDQTSLFTPTKSDGSRSFLSAYSDLPNYMAYTESSKVKVRSLSAPKLRPQYERSNSTKRCSIHGYGESRTTNQRVPTLHANFTNKAYPGSGRLDRLGMPVGGHHWHRY